MKPSIKTICIKHPLRDIVYAINENSFPLTNESTALENYRKAHDEVWHMKLLFEKERGDVLLAIIQLENLQREREELQQMLDFYNEQADMSQTAPLVNIDIKLQVELRDFYNQVMNLHRATIRSYDNIQPLTQQYNLYVNRYYRNEKPIDPLNFTVLDSIFRHHEDMQVDVVSLDKDLQDFLAVLTDVYALFDDYTMQYNELYNIYNQSIENTAQLTKKVGYWNELWDV